MAGITILALLCQGGCGGESVEMPETHAAGGKVLAASGEPLGGGLVEFNSTSGKTYSTNGVIEPDGTFSLNTMVDGETVEGATPDTYQVIVMPHMSDDPEQQHASEPVQLSETFEITAGGENNFTIQLRK
jgi:hypothetical protein